MVRNLIAVVALAIFGGAAVGQTAPKQPDDKRLVTRVYNIKPLFGERGKAMDLAGADAIIKFILQNVPLAR